MKRMKLFLFLVLFATGSVLAQKKEVKYDQYGMEVKWTDLKTEMQDGRLVFETVDGNYKLWYDIRVQTDFAGFFGIDKDYDPIGNGASIRRARFAVKAQLTPDWYGEIDIDMANGFPELKDAVLRYDGIKNVEIQVGNFKENFSMQRNTSSRFLQFMERPMVTYLAPSRHLGANVKYCVPVFWASGGLFFQEVAGIEEIENVQDNNKDYGRGPGYSLTGKMVLRPFNKRIDRGLHIGGAISYRTPKSHDSPSDYGGMRFSTRNSTSINRKKYIDTDVIKGVDHSLLYTAELAGHYKGLRVETAYIGTTLYMKDDAPGNLNNKNFGGWYAQAGYLLFGGTQRYDYWGAKYNRAERGKKWGDVELTARYECLNLNDFDGGVYGGSGEAISVGLNYWVNNNVKFMLNYQYNNNDRYANGKGKHFIGHDAAGKPTKDYTQAVEAKGKGGVDYSMVALRCEVVF
ncbi:MAG TPA: porin [Bacteroidales bacterium]|jgi:phosphate-selective porin OprO/OprP|nr:porin [Bacteroidales bacterium]